MTCSVAEILDTDKVCGACGVVRSLGQFRRVRKDGLRRHRECNECRRRYEKRTGRLKKGLTQLRQHQDPHKVDVLAGALIRAVGGLQRLVVLTQKAFESPGRGGFRFQLLSSILHLIEMSEKLNKDRGDPLDELSNEVLKERLHSRLTEVVLKTPEVAIPVLVDRGWKVEPPGDATQPV